MARRAEHYAQVGTGDNALSVGYSSAQRGEYLGVRYTGPNGKRFEKMTDCKKVDANFHIAAAKHIARVFVPI